ncbi:anti-sigma factor [Subsaxibacter sp. CAU 1640]|uniref:anti-sigma factor n=1 Tax=Subsaxibacter sp. CAU 1640 TaxID=2933271 RepID=UPI0020030569|nr:anti-sigma factor [Subsaxibacter sp. CAU 1640]MCK7590000.1 anti-sigma factor [Subsaxibacter sp. CAU 1640]
MDINAYIESGILELYVAGSLSEEENREIYKLMLKHPEILQEVLEIEAAVIKLTAATSRGTKARIFALIKEKLQFNNNKQSKVVEISKPKYNWFTYTGWAAAIILGIGLYWVLNQNQQLESDLKVAEKEQFSLETQIAEAEADLEDSKELLNVLRAKDIITVPLGGQGNFADTYAKVYWDKNSKQIYLDAKGLPAPPPGKVYQVWSLKLSPLTPVSLGTIDDFMQDENKIFEIENLNESEAFGITLEPTGGSETPTMEQLYTLGVVASNP